jgi:hypothetical protein
MPTKALKQAPIIVIDHIERAIGELRAIGRFTGYPEANAYQFPSCR